MSQSRPSSGLSDEAHLRKSMISSIENGHADVAITMFDHATKAKKGHGVAKLVPTSALTYLLAAKATIMVGERNAESKARDLVDKAMQSADYDDQQQTHYDYLVLLMEHRALARNYEGAQVLLYNDAKDFEDGSHSVIKYRNDLMHLRIDMLKEKDQTQVRTLSKLRDKILLDALRWNTKEYDQVLLDVSWLLLLASARYGHEKTFSAVVHDLRGHRITELLVKEGSGHKERTYHVRENDKQRQYYARIMLRFPLLRQPSLEPGSGCLWRAGRKAGAGSRPA